MFIVYCRYNNYIYYGLDENMKLGVISLFNTEDKEKPTDKKYFVRMDE